MKPYLLLEQQNVAYKYHTFKLNGAPDHAIKHAIEMIDLGNKYGMDIAFDIIHMIGVILVMRNSSQMGTRRWSRKNH